MSVFTLVKVVIGRNIDRYFSLYLIIVQKKAFTVIFKIGFTKDFAAFLKTTST